jgi:hypothetical protein
MSPGCLAMTHERVERVVRVCSVCACVADQSGISRLGGRLDGVVLTLTKRKEYN